MKRVLVITFMLSCILAIMGCSNSNTEITDNNANSFKLGELAEVGDREQISNKIPQWVSDVSWNKPLYAVSSSDIERYDTYAIENFPRYDDDFWTQEQSDTVYLGQGIELFPLGDEPDAQLCRLIYYPVILNGVIVGGFEVYEILEEQYISFQASPLLVNELNAMMDLTSEETPLILGYNNGNTIGIIGDTYYVLDIDHVYHREVEADKIPAIEFNTCVNVMEVLSADRTLKVDTY